MSGKLGYIGVIEWPDVLRRAKVQMSGSLQINRPGFLPFFPTFLFLVFSRGQRCEEQILRVNDTPEP